MVLAQCIQDFNRLTEEQRQKLVNHHGQVLIVEDK